MKKAIEVSMTDAEYVKRVIGAEMVENETELESLRQLKKQMDF